MSIDILKDTTLDIDLTDDEGYGSEPAGSSGCSSSHSTVSIDYQMKSQQPKTLTQRSILDFDKKHKLGNEGKERNSKESVSVSDIFKRFKSTKKKEEEIPTKETHILMEHSNEDVLIIDDFEKENDSEIKDQIEQNFGDEIEDSVIVIPSDDFEHISTAKKPTTTAKDILTGKPQSSRSKVGQYKEIIDLGEHTDDDSVSISQKKKEKKVKKSKKVYRDSVPQESLFVNLKYKTRQQKLKELEEKIKKSMNSAKSATELFRSLNKPPSLKVTLNISPEKLKSLPQSSTATELGSNELRQRENEDIATNFFCKGNNHIEGARSYLDLLLYKPTALKHPISKLKEIEVPSLQKDQVHIRPEGELDEIKYRTLSLPPKPARSHSDKELEIFRYSIKSRLAIRKYKYRPLNVTFENIKYFIENRYTDSLKDLGLLPIYDSISEVTLNSNNELLTDFSKPVSSKEILLDQDVVHDIKEWLVKAFETLKKNVKRPCLKKTKKQDEEFNDFIVDQNLTEDDFQLEDEGFFPLLILQGPEGVGKTTAVYTLVKELEGYVYEINSSQARGRKDILTNLKELSTTQLVQSATTQREFKKGVILFEDVDVLFEDDKGFWSVIENILGISRRPIILTCKELNKIPKTILELSVNSTFKLKKQPQVDLKKYLYLISLKYGYDVEDNVLSKLVHENNNDLRKCLLQLQKLFSFQNTKGLIAVSLSQKVIDNTAVHSIEDLQQYDKAMDCYSTADIIVNNTKSLINQNDPYIPEFQTNDPILTDQSLKDPLPFEFDISNEIFTFLPKFLSKGAVESVATIKFRDRNFMKSKLKVAKRFTRNSLISCLSYGYNDDSEYLNFWDKELNSNYTMDISPIIRELARMELGTIKYNQLVTLKSNQEEKMEESDQLLKRKFEADPLSILRIPYSNWK
ncbi:hypothetical protein WICMUC_000888 [Wickerhamomyces mucosus]|uniref:ATPase AAA-type core domain-containing protein n=1 Tax=Wickerhamomyces mucosus TaxID=1378264 RepID=A0A9P8PXS7_9ASCO|nr:hypothetical protein WICMUC_000888 [Wickerhamomyces mucosus]